MEESVSNETSEVEEKLDQEREVKICYMNITKEQFHNLNGIGINSLKKWQNTSEEDLHHHWF